jgi:hypothetical protein
MRPHVTADVVEPVTDLAIVQALQCRLGEYLAVYRRAAGLSQPALAGQLGRTRSMLSKVKHGHRTMPTHLWSLADQVCGTHGVLVTEHTRLVAAQRSYRDWCQTQHRHAQQQAAQAELEALHASPEPAAGVVFGMARHGQWLTSLLGSQLAGELWSVVEHLVRALGRRDAIRVAAWALTALGLSNLNPDEYTRVAHVAAVPSRVDTQVIHNLAATLAHCKRQEDQLGPREVLDTVIAQHQLVRRLLTGCADHYRTPLRIIDSNMAVTIGGYLVDMGHPEAGKRYFETARRAAHEAHHPGYAAGQHSFAARLTHDTPTALDAAAAARSLAARTNDHQLKSLVEQMAAGAFAFDGQYDPCITATQRAHNHLTHANATVPESPAYWFNHAVINSQTSTFLTLLNRPQQAVDAASAAQKHYDQNYVGGYALCQIGLGHALVLAQEITEAARILANVATQAHLFPRLETDLHTARTQLQPWAHTQAVKTLDEQLHAYELLPARSIMSVSYPANGTI